MGGEYARYDANGGNGDEKKEASSSQASNVDEDALEESEGVCAVDLSRSGRFMFVAYNGGASHDVVAWDVVSGQRVQRLKHDAQVPALKMSADGTRLLTASWDHTLRIW